MSLGAAMAGGGPAENRQSNDFYPTPPDVTRALTIAHDFDGYIHECACGNGAMSMALQLAGYSVVSTDIAPLGFGSRQDFLKQKTLLAPNIVSNPPFELAADFIVHAVRKLEARKVAFVLKSTFWHAKKRTKLFYDCMPAHIHPLLWRPDFLSRGRPTMEVMWCVWEKGHEGFPLYTPLARPEQPVLVERDEELEMLIEEERRASQAGLISKLETVG